MVPGDVHFGHIQNRHLLSFFRFAYYNTPFVGKQPKKLSVMLRIFLSLFVGILDVVFFPLPCPKYISGIFQKIHFYFPAFMLY